MDLSPEAADYLDYGPVGADRERISPEQFAERTLTARELPENLRKIYFGPETAEYFRVLPTRLQQVEQEHARGLATILGEILRGDTSAGSLQTLIMQRLGAPPDVTNTLVVEVTRKFITPNYFQIAQVYEQRHGKAAGAQSAGQRRQDTEGTTSPAASLTPPASPRPAAPPRVVDLRNGTIPRQLPATPPVTPPTTTRSPSPAALPAAPAPPSALPPRAPSADDLLKALGTKATPPPPSRNPPPAPRSPTSSPGSGTHGPLPPSPTGH